MVRQGTRSTKPVKASSRKKIALPRAKVSTGKGSLKRAGSSAPRSLESPYLSGQKMGLTRIKISTEPPENPYADRAAPLIERGRAAKNAQRKGVENNAKNKTLRQERFIKIYREEEEATGKLNSKDAVIESALVKFRQRYGNLCVRTAWSYLKDIN